MRVCGSVLWAVAALGLLAAVTSASAQDAQTCEAVGESTEEVAPGVVLTWDSSFLCADAPERGSYSISVRVANAAGSAHAIEIAELELAQTTPRPRGRAPSATATASGVPLTLAAGESGAFGVSGEYELVETDEGNKANLHLVASGTTAGGDPFELGINVHLRGEDAEESETAAPVGRERRALVAPASSFLFVAM